MIFSRAGGERRALAALVAIATGIAAPTARADGALAEALFREGTKLMDAGKFEEGCPKLAESQRLDPAGGTLLALAFCHERQGKTASAWSEYNEAAALARASSRADREKAALERAAALEPKLARLTIRVASAGTPGLEVLLDDVKLATAAWGSALPVDPGSHTVKARANGFVSWESTTTVSAGAAASAEVPALSRASAAASASAPASGSTQRTLAIVVGSVGLAALVGGGIAGGIAFDRHAEAQKRCPTSPCPDPRGVSANDASRSAAVAADVLTVAGAAATLGGVALFVTSPKPAGPERTGRWTIEAGPFGARMEATW